MTMLDPNLDLTNPTNAVASAFAQAFGLGDSVAATDEWPVDEGDAVIAATLAGAADGVLYLALNEDVAQRLTQAPEVLRDGVQAAVTALGASLGDPTAFEAVEVTMTAGGEPRWIAGISSSGSLTALVGLSLDMVAEVAAPTPDVAPAAPVHAEATVHAAPLGVQAPGHGHFHPEQLDSQRSAFGGRPLSVLHDVDLVVTAELGRTTMPVRELLELTPGMVVEIDRAAGSPIDLLVNGRRIATGEVVVIDEEFGVRITEILAGDAL